MYISIKFVSIKNVSIKNVSINFVSIKFASIKNITDPSMVYLLYLYYECGVSAISII